MDILKVKFKIIQAEWSKNPDLIFNQCFQSGPGSSSLGEFQQKFLFKTSMSYLPTPAMAQAGTRTSNSCLIRSMPNPVPDDPQKSSPLPYPLAAEVAGHGKDYLSLGLL